MVLSVEMPVLACLVGRQHLEDHDPAMKTLRDPSSEIWKVEADLVDDDGDDVAKVVTVTMEQIDAAQ